VNSAAASITLLPSSGAPGAQITVEGTGFDRALVGNVNLYWDTYTPGQYPIGVNDSASNGSFHATATIPPNATEGKHKIIAFVGATQGSADFVVSGKAKKALFLYNADDKTASGFQSIFQGMGMLVTDIIPQSSLPRIDLAGYSLIIAGPDTASWDPKQVIRLLRSGKPVLAIGSGGHELLGSMNLPVGKLAKQSLSSLSILVDDLSNPIFQGPYRFTGGSIDMYKQMAAAEAVLLPGTIHRVVDIGMPADSKLSALVENSGRFFLWGYARQDLLTDSAQMLLVNVIWELLQYNANVDTLILVDYARMTGIGYTAGDVSTLQSKVNTLVALPSANSKMTAVVRDLGVNGPASLHTARNNWTYEGVAAGPGINSVSITNAYVSEIDHYIEQLKQNHYPELKYVIIVGAHEVIPMKARDTDDMASHPESSWGTGLPSSSGTYLRALMSDPGANNLGHYLTDSIYGDLSYINNGYGVNNELVPELGVGRLVESPTQISTLIDNYIAGNGRAAYGGRASIGSSDYMDGAQDAANILGTGTDTSLILSTYNTNLVPGVINAHNAFVYLAGHGNYNYIAPGFVAGADGANGDTEELNMLPNSVVVPPGCHNGVNFGDRKYHAYSGNTTYGEFPERMAENQVGVYLGATGYTWISASGNSTNPANNGWNEKLATLFIQHFRKDGSASTPGKAFKAAVNDYAASAGFANYTQRVLAIATLYGFPTYYPPQAIWSIVKPSIKYGYSLVFKPLTLGNIAQASLATPAEQEITLLVNNWSIGKDGLIQIPGAEYSSNGGPLLPVMTVNQLFPPGSHVTDVQMMDGSVYKDIPNDVPISSPAVVPEDGKTSIENPLQWKGFYPTSPVVDSETSTLGDGGVNLVLSIWPVQYDQGQHLTRIWTKLVIHVTYTVETLSSDVDQDVDGQPDYWETSYGLDPNNASGIQGPAGDFDGDGLTNEQELASGTNPTNPDSDGDGVADGKEAGSGTDPLDPGSMYFYINLPTVKR